MKKLLTISLLLVSCEVHERVEIISYSEFYNDVLKDDIAIVIYSNEDDYIRGTRYDGSKFETTKPLFEDERAKRILEENGVNIEYKDFDNKNVLIAIFPILIILIYLFFPILSAFLASSRGQSKALWFFLTLIFPFAVLFIAMKDKVKEG